MDLLLWRHAEAEPGEPDAQRALTAKGLKQAHKMGKWLDQNLPSECLILVSPTVRTVQTAQALGRRFQVHAGIGPEATAEDLLRIADWTDSPSPVLIIGHQPTLGQTASLLLTSTEQDWTIRKANVWWIVQRERNGITSNYLKGLISPALVMT